MSLQLIAAEMADARLRNADRGRMAWAYELRRREAAGRGGITEFQCKAWREALRVPPHYPADAPIDHSHPETP